MQMRNEVFLRIVAKIIESGLEPKIERIQNGLTETEALDLEKKMVSHYGRIKNGGILANLTDGGEGVTGHSHNTSTKEMMALLRRRRGPQVGSFKGVSKHKSGSWSASIEISGKRLVLGRFPTGEDAAKAYDAAAYEAWGPDCFFNFPECLGSDFAKIDKKVTKELAMRLRKPSGAFKGVIFDRRREKWQPKIRIGGKARYPGTFSTPEEAALAYDKAAISAWGYGNCYLNFPEKARALLAERTKEAA
ncbi:hypothetical protein ATN81_19040 [Agrobacterium pusense]|nr:hypothetical protein ATN81_19040 [Agrobacterium pusense]OJH57691.1 hypothetical protein BA725_20940 [Agrobacterium pusense]